MLTLKAILNKQDEENHITLKYISQTRYGVTKKMLNDNLPFSHCNISKAVISLYERGYIELRELRTKGALVNVMYLATGDGKKWNTQHTQVRHKR